MVACNIRTSGASNDYGSLQTLFHINTANQPLVVGKAFSTDLLEKFILTKKFLFEDLVRWHHVHGRLQNISISNSLHIYSRNTVQPSPALGVIRHGRGFFCLSNDGTKGRVPTSPLNLSQKHAMHIWKV